MDRQFNLLYKNGDTGKCPFCGSNHIKTIETAHGWKSLTFVCENCNESCHIDGRIIKNEKIR